MPSQFLLDMSDMATPRQAALGNCEENMENAQDLRTLHLGTHNCRGNALRAGLVQSVKDLHKLHRYLILGLVNCAKVEFHPSIKQHLAQIRRFSSDQGGSLHCLNRISNRAASAAQPS